MNVTNFGFIPGHLFYTVKIPLDHENKWKQGTTEILYTFWQPFIEQKQTLNAEAQHVKYIWKFLNTLSQYSLYIPLSS